MEEETKQPLNDAVRNLAKAKYALDRASEYLLEVEAKLGEFQELYDQF
jgi:hypothetical protein